MTKLHPKPRTRRGPFQVVGTRRVYQNPWMSVREDRVIRPGGRRGIFGVVEILPGVSIVALDDRGYCCLIREFGYALGRSFLQLPAGSVDRGEKPLPAAKRELREETGLIARRWHSLERIHYYTAILDTSEHLFLALGARKVARPSSDERALIRVMWVPLSKAAAMAARGSIRCAESATAILRADRYLERIKHPFGK